jgi:hypothetical protein
MSFTQYARTSARTSNTTRHEAYYGKRVHQVEIYGRRDSVELGDSPRNMGRVHASLYMAHDLVALVL